MMLYLDDVTCVPSQYTFASWLPENTRGFPRIDLCSLTENTRDITNGSGCQRIFASASSLCCAAELQNYRNHEKCVTEGCFSRSNFDMTAELKIFLCSWNVAQEDPSDEYFQQLLGLNGEEWPDVIGVGLQEVHSLASAAAANLYSDNWTVELGKFLAPRGYCQFKHVFMQGLLLLAYVKRCHLPYVRNIESEYTKTGLTGYWGNKGGLSIRADLYGVNFIIVNSHLAAHLHDVDGRIKDFQSILASQQFRDPDVDNILDHDYVFWMGDLNFRLDDISRQDIIHKIEGRNFKDLLPYDQLLKAKEEGRIFLDFDEGELSFPPTYKFDKDTDIYDTSSKRRKPAWCDRILWMVHEDSFENALLNVELINYTSLTSIRFSDHRPVVADFKIQVLRSPSPPDVTFKSIYQWITKKDVKCYYRFKEGASVNDKDWIGLYKVDFTNFRDYVAWAKADRSYYCDYNQERHVHFHDKQMHQHAGRYVLCYINGVKEYVRGMSNIFTIEHEINDISSESDDSVYESDDTDEELETINKELRERRFCGPNSETT